MKKTVTGIWRRVEAAERPPEKPLPSMGKMVSNALRAGGHALKAAAKGEKLRASTGEIARREAICRDDCDPPGGWYRASDDRCSHPECGCRLEWKRRLKVWHCPAGKW